MTHIWGVENLKRLIHVFRLIFRAVVALLGEGRRGAFPDVKRVESHGSLTGQGSLVSRAQHRGHRSSLEENSQRVKLEELEV